LFDARAVSQGCEKLMKYLTLLTMGINSTTNSNDLASNVFLGGLFTNLSNEEDRSVRRFSTIAFTLLMLSAAASAQIPTKGNIFFGYSYNRADFNAAGHSNLNGWEGSLEGKFLPWVGLVADISGHYGSHDSVYNVIFGPRVSVTVGKFTPFAHALLGVGHFSSNSSSDTSFSDALGGGIDYRVFHGIGWRFQGDALQTRFFGNTQDDFRFSTGIVLHF
jgi:hypothetical protein